MKKLFVVISLLILTASARAVSLFPFFGDLVGDYFDGPVQELQPLGINCLYSDKCHWFNSIKDADMFLDDVLPYENYSISREKIQKDGINMEIYTSPLIEGTSMIRLIELPGDGLYVTYDELPEESSQGE